MNITEYNQIAALNYSGAKQLLKSPAHYKAWLTAEPEQTPALKFGSHVHLAALQPEVFDCLVRPMPECDRRTKEGKAIYEAFAATLRPGEEAVKREELDHILAVAESAQAGIEQVAKGNVFARMVEETYTSRFNGVNIKGRPDLVLKGIDECVVVDIKTTMDASPKAFARDCYKYMYHLQAAFYMHLTGAKAFYLVAVEKEAPYAFAVYKLDDAAIELGKTMMTTATAIFGSCNLYDQWPAYPQEPQVLSLPKWASSDSLDA